MYKQLGFQIIRGVIMIGIFIVCYFLLSLSFPFIYPFIIAIIFSFIIHPFVAFLERKLNMPRVFATIIVLFTIIFIICGIIFLMITELIQGTAYLAENIPTYFQGFITVVDDFIYTKLLPIYQKIMSLFHTLTPIQQETINENIQQFTSYIASAGALFLQSFFLKIPMVLAILPNSLTVIIVTILATFLITNDWYMLRKQMKRITPIAVHTFCKDIVIHLKKALTGYVKAQLTIVFISTSIIYIGLLLLKIEHALTLTFFAALADLFPFVGTGIIFIPWLIYLFVTGNYSITLGIAVLYMVVVLLRQILEPRILSTSIGLNPLLGLIVLFISFQIWGVLGIFIAPIILIMLYVFIQAGILKEIWAFIKA